MISRKALLAGRSFCQQLKIRTLLSQAYQCSKEWQEYSKAGILKDLDPYDGVTQVLKKFGSVHSATGVDVDIASHVLVDKDQLSELKDIFYKLRRSPNAAHVLDSTHHATARKFWVLEDVETFLQIVEDPLNYGLFPDDIICNCIMDWLLDRERYNEARRIAAYLMKQEMLDNPLTCWLSLLSCSRNLEEGLTVEVKDEEQAEEELDEEDELVFKFPYLKNIWNDGHFDLEEPQVVIGKTLVWASRSLGLTKETSASANANLLGQLLMKDFDGCKLTLDRMEEKGLKICSNLGDLSKETLGAEPAESSEETTEDVDDEQSEIEELRSRLSSLPQSTLTLSAEITRELRRGLEKMEKADIKRQKRWFGEWTEKREQQFMAQSEKVALRDRIRSIDAELAAVAKRRRLLSFFERREELEEKHSDAVLKGERAVDPSRIPTDEEFAKLLRKA